jgi:hypothetical protein
MKAVIYLILMTYIIGLIIFGCKDNTEQLIISGQLIKHTSCKDNFKSASEVTPDSLSCIDYSFDGDNQLSIRHINAGICFEIVSVPKARRILFFTVGEANIKPLLPNTLTNSGNSCKAP